MTTVHGNGLSAATVTVLGDGISRDSVTLDAQSEVGTLFPVTAGSTSFDQGQVVLTAPTSRTRGFVFMQASVTAYGQMFPFAGQIASW